MRLRKRNRRKTGLSDIAIGLITMVTGTHKVARGITTLKQSNVKELKTPTEPKKYTHPRARMISQLKTWTEEDEQLAAIYPARQIKKQRRYDPHVEYSGAYLFDLLQWNLNPFGWILLVLAFLPLCIIMIEACIIMFVLSMIRDVLDRYLGQYYDTAVDWIYSKVGG